MHISRARLASFCYLGFISDPLTFSKFHNETHDPKGQENKIYIVKGRETFFRRHTVQVTSCSEVKYVLKREPAFLELHSFISNDIVCTKINDKCNNFDFKIVNFPFSDDDVPRFTSYGVYISQLIRFARASSHVADFNTCNKLLTQRIIKQGCRYHKLRKNFLNFIDGTMI